MEGADKAIEIMKAAMEKEKVMMERSNEAMEQTIEGETQETADRKMQTENQEECDVVEEAEAIQAQSTAEDTVKQEKSGKSLFKNSKNKELAAKDEKIEELTDRLVRNMAEFDNFRKRSEKEKSMMYDMGTKSMIEKILPVVDNFERGFNAITEKDKEGAFAQGIELIYKQLLTALEEVGVKPIDAVGKEFDPNLHNAVMHGEDDNIGENIVSDEFLKGYMFRDMVVRHSMVKVVN